MNRNTLITVAGVILFLAAGMYTMIFFPERQTPKQTTAKTEKTDVALKTGGSPAGESIMPEIEIASDELKGELKSEIKNETLKPDWWVYVTGEVKKPGCYKISADSRIFQAIEIAGGFTEKADQASVNMAAVLVDGYQINVEAKGAKKNPASNSNVRVSGIQANPVGGRPPVVIYQEATRPEVKAIHDGKVDINSATAKELEILNGVGEATAKKIIEYRNSHGRFSKPEDLLNVKGIGEAKLKKMKPQILIR